jgi:hypothetical protein
MILFALQMLGMITFFSASTVPFEESFTLYVPFPTAFGASVEISH